jgi:hypothetical protein
MIENLADFDQKPIAETVDMLVTTHCRHAKRRLDEVRSLAALFADAGLTPVMTPATERLFVRTVSSEVPDWATARGQAGLDECLEKLAGPARKSPAVDGGVK